MAAGLARLPIPQQSQTPADGRVREGESKYQKYILGARGRMREG